MGQVARVHAARGPHWGARMLTQRRTPRLPQHEKPHTHTHTRVAGAASTSRSPASCAWRRPLRLVPPPHRAASAAHWQPPHPRPAPTPSPPSPPAKTSPHPCGPGPCLESHRRRAPTALRCPATLVLLPAAAAAAAGPSVVLRCRAGSWRAGGCWPGSRLIRSRTAAPAAVGQVARGRRLPGRNVGRDFGIF